MKRLACLGILTLTGVSTIAVTNEARQPRATLHLQEVANNLYMLGNEPGGRGDARWRQHRHFRKLGGGYAG